MAKSNRFECKLKVLASLGLPLQLESRILDFGCGAGTLVQAMREQGYSAYGIDLSFKEGKYTGVLADAGYLRLMSTDDYRIPFEDNTFDLVSTDQVFEHVQNHGMVLSEISRVLKPGGISLNVYPPRLIPIEPHVFVPLASAFRAGWWLCLWALLGVRSTKQKGMSYREVATENAQYLSAKTNYIPDSVLRKVATGIGFEVISCEKEMLESYNKLTQLVMKVNKIVRILPWVCRTFISRVVILKKS